MIWSRLKSYECPRCKNQLGRNEFTEEHICAKCHFRISFERFDDIVNDIYKPRASDSYGERRSSIDEFNSGEFDAFDDHDKFWLNKEAME